MSIICCFAPSKSNEFNSLNLYELETYFAKALFYFYKNR